MYISAVLIAAPAGPEIATTGVFQNLPLTNLESDANGQATFVDGKLSVPPGEYHVDADVSLYANGITGDVRARVTAANIVEGLAGYVDGNGSFNSRISGTLIVNVGQLVAVEVRGVAGMKAGYGSYDPGVLTRLSLIRV